ncbi:MAG: hypothetical protein ACI8P3_000487 [Saprospiraceae bacterium]|jgi:hypothetical protein
MTKSVKYIITGIALIIIFLMIYGLNDPEINSFFPKCPFLSLTGYECPGCGSQRAIHQFLQGNVVAAFWYNPLFVLALPYLIIGGLFEFTPLKSKYAKAQRLLFGYKTIYVILVIIISFWIWRNVA